LPGSEVLVRLGPVRPGLVAVVRPARWRALVLPLPLVRVGRR
jgi:hypothetical protein